VDVFVCFGYGTNEVCLAVRVRFERVRNEEWGNWLKVMEIANAMIYVVNLDDQNRT
jgi:hypothetical protein